MLKQITIIGAGLAGSEAAWQLISGIEQYSLPYKVTLYEMRPKVKTPAHHTDNFAELVCSNSLGSEFLTTARGLLINEMQKFDSLIINSAIKAKVPAGQALAVDRDVFAAEITKSLESSPHLEIIRDEFDEDMLEHLKKSEYIIIASGPLSSANLVKRIQDLLDRASPENSSKNFLYFFDAASPILNLESVNMDIAFKASRYGKGETDDYINCPFYSQEDFDKFYEALVTAERAPLKEFEKETLKFFEGCMPIEAIADRGKKTLCFGPMKPVGLRDPRDPDRRPVAVVQLRQDNVVGSLYNIVGFQTNLKWAEQKRVFSMIPGLENIDIVRYGVMHQNIFINSPSFLNADMSMRQFPNIYFAGQITGVEGYTESAATGIIAARSIIASLRVQHGVSEDCHPEGGQSPLACPEERSDVRIGISLLERSSCRPFGTPQDDKYLPKETMMGSLANYISSADPKHFQPINSNWGLLNFGLENLDKKILKDKAKKHEFMVERSLALL